jgi:hypothetical protein
MMKMAKASEADLKRQEILSLEEGDAVLQWPANISADSMADVEEWVSFLLKRLRRKLAAQAAKSEGQAPDDEDREP